MSEMSDLGLPEDISMQVPVFPEASDVNSIPSGQLDAHQDHLVGQVLDERYRIDSVLGVGGMGTVYKAYHLLMEREVALKILAPYYSQNPQMIRRFKREGLVISKLSHPNIVTVFDYGETSAGLYLVMEYLQGLTLRQVLDACERMTPKLAVDLMKQVVGALEHSHAAGIIHRDIKPANIFLLPRYDGSYTAKLLDFGVAKLKVPGDEHTMTQASGVLGTPKYMAPEQVRTSAAHPSVDLYSIGIILYEMLAGHVPFDGEHPLGILMDHQNKPVPALELSGGLLVSAGKLPQIALRCLEKKPRRRYESSSRLLEALQEWIEEPVNVLPSGASPASESTSRRPSQPPLQRKWWRLIFIAVTLGSISGWVLFQRAASDLVDAKKTTFTATQAPRMVELRSTPQATVIRLSDRKVLGVTPLRTPVDTSERLQLAEKGFAPIEIMLTEATPSVVNLTLEKSDGKKTSNIRPKSRKNVDRGRVGEFENIRSPRPKIPLAFPKNRSQKKEAASDRPLEFE